MQRRLHVRVGEVIALEEQRFAAFSGQGEGEAVAEIEPGGMTTALAGSNGLVSTGRQDRVRSSRWAASIR